MVTTSSGGNGGAGAKGASGDGSNVTTGVAAACEVVRMIADAPPTRLALQIGFIPPAIFSTCAAFLPSATDRSPAARQDRVTDRTPSSTPHSPRADGSLWHELLRATHAHEQANSRPAAPPAFWKHTGEWFPE